MSKLAPPARKQGFTVQINGSSYGGVMVVLGNRIKDIVIHAKLSPFNGKKDLVGLPLWLFIIRNKKSIIERALRMSWTELKVLMIIGHVGRKWVVT